MGLLVNQMKAQKFKKFFQVSTYLPHFISTVVMAGMLILFLSPSTGIIAKLVGLLGFKLPNLMGSAKAFPHIYVWSEAWQHVGWDQYPLYRNTSSVDPTLYEAATMDGANNGTNDPHRCSGSAADGNHHVYHENGKRHERWI